MKNVYERAGATLFQGDCVDVLAGMAPESADLIFADPPYHLSNDGITCRSGRMACVNKGEWDASAGIERDFAFHQAWIGACKRVLKPDGTIWISGTYHSIYACGFALLTAGFKILNDICWYKPNAAPNMSCRFFTASHETLIWAKKNAKARHTFNYDDMKNGVWEHDALKKPGRQMRSVWQISTPGVGEKKCGRHPTQKPVALLKRLILAASRAGDLVLDPFAGSGTTGVAALELGRTFIGIEKDETYVALAIKRLEEAAAKREEQDRKVP